MCHRSVLYNYSTNKIKIVASVLVGSPRNRVEVADKAKDEKVIEEIK